MSSDEGGRRKIALGLIDVSAFDRFNAHATRWCRTHPALLVGSAEIALGAALIAWGVQSGAIELGLHLVGTAGDITNSGGLAGAATGTMAAVVAAKIIGSVGIAAMGTAVCIPATLIAGGGALVLGGLGCQVGDVTYGLLNSFDKAELLGGGPALLVGLALVLDGCRRVTTDDLLRIFGSTVRDGVIELGVTSARVVVTTLEELKQFSVNEAVTIAAPAAIAATGGAVIGSSLAAGSVTVLGSKALGSAALSLGLISAPVWPVVAAAVAVGGITALIGFRVAKARRARLRD